MSPAAAPVDSQPTGRTLLDDVVTDILARVDAALREGDETDAALAQVEREVRRDWGGERPYIAKNGEGDRVRQEKSHRDERIRTDYRHGERIALLARRYGISERRVRMILAA
jgi:Mor family transcriptional regulator